MKKAARRVTAPRRLRPQHKWWAVAAVYKAIHPNTTSRYRSKAWGELQVFLVDAPDRDSAERLGRELAKERQHQYRAVTGDLVCWKFDRLEHTVEVLADAVGHGTEIYYDWRVDHTRRERKPLTV